MLQRSDALLFVQIYSKTLPSWVLVHLPCSQSGLRGDTWWNEINTGPDVQINDPQFRALFRSSWASKLPFSLSLSFILSLSGCSPLCLLSFSFVSFSLSSSPSLSHSFQMSKRTYTTIRGTCLFWIHLWTYARMETLYTAAVDECAVMMGWDGNQSQNSARHKNTNDTCAGWQQK